MEFKENVKTFRERAGGKTSFEPGGEEHDLDEMFGEDIAATAEPRRHKIKQEGVSTPPRGGRAKGA